MPIADWKTRSHSLGVPPSFNWQSAIGNLFLVPNQNPPLYSTI
jgi:hypothetical protein